MNKTNISKGKMTLLKTIISIVLVVFVLPIMAQQTTQDHNEQVTIVGSYDPSINEAFKINTKAVADDIVSQKQEFSFDFLSIKQNTEVEVNPIKAITMSSGSRTNKYDNYLKAGFGSRLSPLLDFYHSSGDKGNYNFNANIFHYSSFNDIPDYSSSPFSNTHAKIGYSKFMGSHILDLGFTYGLNTNRYYGYKPADWPNIDIPESDLKQMFNLIKADVGIRSAYKKASKLHHEVGIGAYYYFDKFKTSELNAYVDFDLYKAFDVVDALDYQNFGLMGEFQFYSNTDSLLNSTDIYINAQPYFKAKYGQFSFKAGLNFGYLIDTASSFHFWPVIELNMNIVPGSFSIYAGVDGKLEKQTYLGLTSENPFLTSVTQTAWLNEKINVYAGLRASFAQIVGLDIKAGWKSFENMAFFVNQAEYHSPAVNPIGPLNKFTTIYDNGNVFYASAELSFVVGKDLKLWLGGEFNTYGLDSLQNAYHKPLSIFRFGGSYLIASKVKLSAEMSYNGKRYALDTNGLTPTEVELDPYLDLNLGIEYKINDNFSAFINGTNLLNKNYDRFYSYPVQGIQLMGGIIYKF